ncbi:hypothetical protein H6G20_05340 [Desertifilum sp. FACHB-1129]|uniref:hypothetical protein n=1 Tax=unclassified Desertifilum TaxID=2621682 RepID=UPI001686EE66|nr:MULTISPECIES: hypothetical protein [unclassified Desertifilum]MBD2311107.1 hypothetical protein [Desertifilum sp. FACHB-1129]MBD2323974.1 hypothetical protein [Desertifilum sp. FACHB-866]MBD2333909.1 hypothetical protein [Desertifilum sp. FACHB-868]MDA0211220.1 hypothetical protein [Cyanobacteria bacterium FC1]
MNDLAHNLTSEEFSRYSKGQLSDDECFIERATDDRHSLEYDIDIPMCPQPTPLLLLQRPMLSPEQLQNAMETIDRLSGWLDDTGLKQAAIAQWKFNALAAMYPDLREVTELAKQLIGSSSPLPDAGMSVTEVASLLTESLETKIKPEQVNQALVTLGYQSRNEQKRIWILTEAGMEHGTSLLATSGNNKWQGTQVKWHRSILAILENYFREEINSTGDADESVLPLEYTSSSNSSQPQSNASSKTQSKSKKTWTIAERIKELNLKSNPTQIQLIQDFADELYKEKHGTLPSRLSGRKSLTSSYPTTEVELIDRAIAMVFDPQKKAALINA